MTNDRNLVSKDAVVPAYVCSGTRLLRLTSGTYDFWLIERVGISIERQAFATFMLMIIIDCAKAKRY